jgi:hypothetical protein
MSHVGFKIRLRYKTWIDVGMLWFHKSWWDNIAIIDVENRAIKTHILGVKSRERYIKRRQ